jgi:hypothetical protein
MTKCYLITSLRAQVNQLMPYNPGYLAKATENHRHGFLINDLSPWFAFVNDPLQAIQFTSIEQAEQRIAQIIDSNNGWNRPLSIVVAYL